MEEGGDEQDWPSGVPAFPQCQALEEAVHCSICRDYFDTPLSLLCGHSFCSQCIRSNIQFQERSCSRAYCPQCREPTDSRQIHANHQLRDIVKHFLLARPYMVAAMSARPNPGRAQMKRKMPERASSERGQQRVNGKQHKLQALSAAEDVIQLDSTSEREEACQPPARQLRRRSTPVEYFPKEEQESGAEEEQDSEAEVVEDSEASSIDEDLEYESPLQKRKLSQDPNGRNKKPVNAEKKGLKGLPNNWALCPVCNGSFPMAIFNDHLDKCLNNPGQPGQVSGDQRPQGKKTLQVPPKLLLSLEKDKSLRDRLKKYGLSTKGSRQELEQRYTRFRVEVQSAIDRSEAGISYDSIAKRITGREISEAQAGGKLPLLRPSNTLQKGSSGKDSDFQDLIKAVKARHAAHSGKPGSSSMPASNPEDRGLPAGEDAEVNSQPSLSASQSKEPRPASNSMPAIGFRRPNRVLS